MIAWWDLPEDEQDAALDAEMRAKSRAIGHLRGAIAQSLGREEAFVAPSTFPRNCRMIVHPSAKGPRWQLTWIDDDGPVGDTQPQTLTHAAHRVWEDLPQAARQAWIEKSTPVEQTRAPGAWRGRET